MSVMEKIRKLRVVAERSSNQNEAHAAALAAQRLMVNHNLTEAEVGVDPGVRERLNPVTEETVEYQGKLVQWRFRTLAVVANNFRCQSWLRRARQHSIQAAIGLIGRKEDVEVCREVYQHVVTAQDRLCHMYIDLQRRENVDLGIDYPVEFYSDLRASFREGFIGGLATKFREQVEANTGWALVLVKDAEVVAYAQQRLRGRPVHSNAKRGQDRAAYNAGFTAGHQTQTGKLVEG